MSMHAFDTLVLYNIAACMCKFTGWDGGGGVQGF